MGPSVRTQRKTNRTTSKKPMLQEFATLRWSLLYLLPCVNSAILKVGYLGSHQCIMHKISIMLNMKHVDIFHFEKADQLA